MNSDPEEQRDIGEQIETRLRDIISQVCKKAYDKNADTRKTLLTLTNKFNMLE